MAGVPCCGPWKKIGAPSRPPSRTSGQGASAKGCRAVAVRPPTVTAMGPEVAPSPTRTSSWTGAARTTDHWNDYRIGGDPTMLDFRDHVVLVTGAGAGIGFGIARAFHEAGARVALGDLRETAVARAATKLGNSGRVYTRAVDVRDARATA